MMRYEVLKYERIRNMRVDRDLSQTEIANVLHVAQNTYSQYELGTNNIPLEAMVRLADFYDTSVYYLLGRTDEIKPYPPAKRRKDRG